MNRRLAIKHLAIASAAAYLLPSCVKDREKLSLALNKLAITVDDEALLAQIADVIIPATDTPGAKAVEAHLFTLIMVDDCFSNADQEKYLKGMRSFDKAMKSFAGKSFMKSSPDEQLEILTLLEQRLDKESEDVQFFYSKTRDYVLTGYVQSQHFLTNIKPYQLIPGPDFKGCLPIVS
jgi:hypothetical protein